MKTLSTILLTLTLAFQPLYMLSQAGEQDASCWWCKPAKHLNASPYEFGFKRELPYLITGAGLLTTGVILNLASSVVPVTEEELNSYDRNDVNSFDRPATYNWSENADKASDFFMAGAILVPALLLSSRHTRSEFGSLVVMGLEVAGITYGLTQTVKHIAYRARPYVYNPDVPLEDRTSSTNRLSFFSGHASFSAAMTFFTAKVLNDYHPNMKIGLKITLWTAAAALPAVTAYLRVEAGQHFPTDVITGYAVGAVAGWLIPHLHKKKTNRSMKYSLSPVFYQGTTGLHLSVRL